MSWPKEPTSGVSHAPKAQESGADAGCRFEPIAGPRSKWPPRTAAGRKRTRRGKAKNRGEFRQQLLSSAFVAGRLRRCTPLLLRDRTSAAMLSSFEEASGVFMDRGVNLGINTIRQIAQRFAARQKSV